jgi:BirA family transcriptional regulator, biotin operon repressor / biotin---[acetyl-CoA-carboxylase] ligase
MLAPDLTSDQVLDHLRGTFCPWSGPISILKSTISTNDLAKQAAQQGAPEGSVFVAEEQSQGRGRQGRSWLAPPSTAILASVVLRPRLPIAALPPIALVAGLAISDVLAVRVPEKSVGIKWPNDIWIHSKKVSGILIESISHGASISAVIVGFGINVRATPYPPEIAALATNLEAEGASEEQLHRSSLLASVLTTMQAYIADYTESGLQTLLPALQARDVLYGKKIVTEQFSGIARGFNSQGCLLIEDEKGIQYPVMAGEIHLSPNLT